MSAIGPHTPTQQITHDQINQPSSSGVSSENKMAGPTIANKETQETSKGKAAPKLLSGKGMQQALKNFGASAWKGLNKFTLYVADEMTASTPETPVAKNWGQIGERVVGEKNLKRLSKGAESIRQRGQTVSSAKNEGTQTPPQAAQAGIPPLDKKMKKEKADNIKIQNLAKKLAEKGCIQEGMFRLSGSKLTENKALEAKDQKNFDETIEVMDSNQLAGLMKRIVREAVNAKKENSISDDSLKAFAKIMLRVAENKETTKMGAENIAIASFDAVQLIFDRGLHNEVLGTKEQVLGFAEGLLTNAKERRSYGQLGLDEKIANLESIINELKK